MIANAKIIGANTRPELYHAATGERGSAGFTMSCSALREFDRCPQRWCNGYVSPESDAKAWGSLLDALLTGSDTFFERFAVKPPTYKDAKTGEEKPWNGNSLVCKSWLAEHAEFEIISEAQHVESLTALTRLRNDEVVAAFVDDSDKQVWVSGEWQDEGTGLVVPLKGLLDFVPRNDTEFHKCLGDLKAVRNGALIPFQRQVWQLGWHLQGAFYLDLYLAAVEQKEDRNTFCFIVQENYPPYQSAKRILTADFLALGRAQYQRALKNYCACLKAGRWPGYDDNDEAVQGWSLCAPEPWMEQSVLFGPKFDFEAESAEAPQVEEGEIVP